MKMATALVIFLLLNLATFAEGQSQKPSQEMNGRYQMWGQPTDSGFVFLLDTWTGKTWMHKIPQQTSGRTVFVYVDRLDSPQEVSEWVSRYQSQEPKR